MIRAGNTRFLERDLGPLFLSLWNRLHHRPTPLTPAASQQTYPTNMDSEFFDKTIKIDRRNEEVNAFFYVSVSPGVKRSASRNLTTGPPPSEPTTTTTADPVADLRAILHFNASPSAKLCDYYTYLDKEHSEENLEFWLILRNHNLQYKRYRKLKEQKVTGRLESSLSSNDNNKILHTTAHHLQDHANGDTKRVDRKLLRRSATHILNLYLLPGSPKEINLHSKLQMKVKHAIEEEDRYDPMIFSEVRESVFEMMRKDSYPRFLKSYPEQ